MFNVKSTNEEKVKVNLNPATSTGKPITVDPLNPPKWSVIDGKAILAPAADGLSCFLISADGDAGLSHIKIDADADLGGGVKDISDTIEYEVTGAQAARLGLSAEPPVPK